jgi:thioredoxin reductase (NADPH)
MTKHSETGTMPLVKIIGKHGSALGYAIRDFLYRSGVPFEWVNLKTDEQARKQAGVEHLHDSRLPVCIFPDGTRMECPTIRQITESWDGSKTLRILNMIWRSMVQGRPV